MGNTKIYRRNRIRQRIKKVISGTSDFPRLSVFRSNKEIYVQLINDIDGTTILAASSKDVKGTKTEQNPWGSNTLEWDAPIERIHGNWPGELPTVHRWAYDYSNPNSVEDFVPQTVPLKEGEEEH